MVNTYQHICFFIYFYLFNILQTFVPKISRGTRGEERDLQTPPTKFTIPTIEQYPLSVIHFGSTEVGVRLSSISRTLHNFSTVFFSIYRGILERKNDTSILRKSDSFANKPCCGLTALFVKRKFTFAVVTSQINKQTKIPSIVFSYRLCSQ